MRILKLSTYLDLFVSFAVFCVFTIRRDVYEGTFGAITLFLISFLPILVNVAAYSCFLQFLFKNAGTVQRYLLRSASLSFVYSIEILVWAGLVYFLAVQRGEHSKPFLEVLAQEYFPFVPVFALVSFMTPSGFELIGKGAKERASV